MTSTRKVIVVSVFTIATALSASPTYALPGEDLVSDAVGGGMSGAFDMATQGVVRWILEGVAWFIKGVGNYLQAAATPEVQSVWFSGPDSPYASVRSIAVMMLLGFLLLGIISGLMHGDVGGMLRRMAGSLPAAVAGMVVTTEVVAKLLALTDALSTTVLTGSGGHALDFFATFTTAALMTNNGFAAALVGIFAAISAFLLWIELMLRSTLVYFLVALSPLAFAAIVWPAARGVLRRLVELLLAVILSKLIICIALSVGAAALVGAGQTASADAGPAETTAAGMGTLMGGAALLTLACWSPFLFLKMLPIVESAVVAQGISRGPVRAAQTGLNTASMAGSVSRLAGPTNGGAAGSGRGASTAGESTAGSSGTNRMAGSSPSSRPPSTSPQPNQRGGRP